jgi:hypothetical protein
MAQPAKEAVPVVAVVARFPGHATHTAAPLASLQGENSAQTHHAK